MSQIVRVFLLALSCSRTNLDQCKLLARLEEGSVVHLLDKGSVSPVNGGVLEGRTSAPGGSMVRQREETLSHTIPPPKPW